GHNVVPDRETEACALSSRFGRKKRLKELVLYLARNARPVVACPDFDRIAEISRRNFKRRLKIRVASLLMALVRGIEAIAEQVQTHARDVLGNEFNGCELAGVMVFGSDVEGVIRGAVTKMIGAR